MKRFPEDDPEGLFPRRGRRGRGKTTSRQPRLSSSIRYSGTLQRVLPRHVQADLRLEASRELAQSLASDGAPGVVLDTNVVAVGITGLIDGEPGAAGRILQMVLDGRIMPMALPHLSRELNGLGAKRRQGNPESWTDAHEKLLKTYKLHVNPLGLADTTLDGPNLGEALEKIVSLVPDDHSDVRGTVASALISGKEPLPVVTGDRHILDKAATIQAALEVPVVDPDEFWELMAPALLTDDEK